MAFDGNILYFYNKSTGEYDSFNIQWMNVGTYSSTPLRRTELKATRDNRVTLHRTTSPNHKTGLSFTTCPLHLAEMQKLRAFINSHFILKIQRKVKVKYWCDETMTYEEGEMYMADSTYTYLDVDTKNKDILYAGVTYEFEQY